MISATFAEHLQAQGRSPLTIMGYGSDLGHFVIWYQQTNGQPLVDLFTPTDVREYKAWLQSNQRAAPATINRRLAALRAYGAWLVESGLAEFNPAAAARGVREQATAPRGLDKAAQMRITRELERGLLAARSDSARREAARNNAIGILLVNTGLRVAELCALVVDDLTMGERSGHLVVRSGKGDKLREVPLNINARKALADWLARRPAGPGPVFTSKHRTALQPRAIQRILEVVGRRAGVELSPHTLRHTFAHNLVNAGVSLDRVAALMGHSKLETTRRYTIPSAAELAQAVGTLDD
jgi:site-specific recombinase XerD